MQDYLPVALGDAEGVAHGEAAATEKLAKGLMLGGFAMQRMASSRPASGAEHRFSHILDMSHHTFNGKSCSHGAQVGVFTLYMTRFIEALLDFDMAALDIDRCVACWPEWEAGGRALALETFAGTDFPDLGVKESVQKWQTKEELRATLVRAKARWPEMVARIRAQLIPSAEVERRLKAVGSPSCPAEIGVAEGFAEAQAELLDALALPRLSYDATADDLMGIMKRDKKVRGGQVRFVLARDVGQWEATPVSDDVVRAGLTSWLG